MTLSVGSGGHFSAPPSNPSARHSCKPEPWGLVRFIARFFLRRAARKPSPSHPSSLPFPLPIPPAANAACCFNEPQVVPPLSSPFSSPRNGIGCGVFTKSLSALKHAWIQIHHTELPSQSARPPPVPARRFGCRAPVKGPGRFPGLVYVTHCSLKPRDAGGGGGARAAPLVILARLERQRGVPAVGAYSQSAGPSGVCVL